MADNVELDPGTGGAVVATDDLGAGGHVQIVKLMDGTDNSSARIPGDATNGLDVDVTRSALPSGAATAANQTTTIGHLDGVETLLGTIDADTGTVAGAVSGSEMQVDVVASLPAGDNNIGNVDIASAIPAGSNAIGTVEIGATSLSALETVSIGSAIPAGNNNIGDVDIASALPAGSNNIGDVDVLTIAAGTNAIGNVGVVPRTTGGLTIFRTLDADETEEEVKATAGQVFGWYLYNDGAAEVYVKFYNATAANVTVGSTTPVLTIPVPAGAAANVFSSVGIAFGTAITVAATTGVADADTAAPAANQVVANVFYA